MSADEEICPADEKVPVVGYGRGFRDGGIVGPLEIRGILFLEGSREHYRIPRLHRSLEIAGDEEIFLAVKTAAVLVGISDSIVPLGAVVILGLGVRCLEHQVREVAVHAEAGSVLHRGKSLVGIVVAVREGVDVAERQEGFEPHRCLCGALQKLVLDKDLVFVRQEHQGLAEENITHLVGYGRIGIRAEIHHVLMPAGFIDIAVAMDAKIELLAVHDKGFVHGGEQQILVPPETVQGDGEQSMIAAGVAGDYAGIAVGARLIDADNLPLQRIREIYKFRFIEF